MKSIKDIFLEITTTVDIPNVPTKLPDDVVDAWKKTLDYDLKMKNKFSYPDVNMKTKYFSRGFKGHLTRAQNNLQKTIQFHKLDPNKTIKQLYSIYPPKYF